MHSSQATDISFAAVISAAGSSSRMGGVKKEYLPLAPGGMTVLGAVVAAFASCPGIGTIAVAVRPGDENGEAASKIPAEILYGDKHIIFVPGGPTRRVSVNNALSFLESCHPTYVLIHDGARPWVKRDLIERCMEATIRYGAVIPALPLTETPKELHILGSCSELDPKEPAFIERHLRREGICTAQTPQGFKFPEILAAHEKAAEREEKECIEYTDDAEVWGEFVGKVAVIAGDPENRKITYMEDLSRRNE